MTEENKEDATTVEGEWTQAHTPGSDVELQKLPNAAEELTTQIDEPADAPTEELTTQIDHPAEPDAAADVPTTSMEIPGLYREVDPAAQLAAERAQLEADQATLAEERARFDAERAEAERIAAERAARDRQLGIVSRTGEQVVPPPPPAKLVTDKFLGSFGLFVLRLVVAGALGIRGYQVLTSDLEATQNLLAMTQLPQPAAMAWVLGISLIAGAVFLLFGVAVRVVGIGLIIGAAISLAFVRWGAFSPFMSGVPGFIGEFEVLLVAIGVLFACLGGGRWGVDGSYRASRAKAKAAAAN